MIFRDRQTELHHNIYIIIPIRRHLDLDCEIVIREAFEELATSLEIFEQERGNWEQERGNFEQERGEKEDMAR